MTNPQQAGQALEDALDLLHILYRRDKRATLWHNGVQSIHGRGGAIIQVDSLPDYGGVLSSLGARAVMFDAKHTQDDTLRYRHPKDRLHQLAQLWDVHQAGGVAFVLVCYKLVRAWVVWPDEVWANHGPYSIILRDGEYATWEATEVTMDENGLPDWLSTVIEAEA